jgi:transglutaminase-like putative cysteine protease
VHLSANKPKISQTPPKERVWDRQNSLFLLTAFLIASWRISATNWTGDLFRLQFLFLTATVLGLSLGYSLFNKNWSIFFSLAYGAFIIPWQLGLTILGNVEWNERLISLWGRFWFSIVQLIEGENVEDPILFYVQMAIILWSIGTFSGYTLNRNRNPWKAIVPTGLLMVMLQTLDGKHEISQWYMTTYVVAALLLVARNHLLAQRDRWQSNRTILPTNRGQDLFQAAALGIILLVMLAWAAPEIASSDNPAKTFWDSATAPFRIIEREFEKAFYSLEGGGTSVLDYYGAELSLGSGIPVENDIMMVAEITLDTILPARFYWRDRVYDSFQNNGWETSFENEARINAGERDQRLQSSAVGVESNIQITSGRNITVLHIPANTVSVSRTTDIQFETALGIWDISAFQSPVVINAGESYSVDSILSNVTIEGLRASGTDYPEWVLERYLQVPEEISERTIQLAAELAADQETVYDIANNITEWLRENIAYVNNLEFPEGDFNAVDWMLFEQQEAFCNYYATAEIMMLRSLGIPARLAVGYAQGEADDRNFLLGGAEGDLDESALDITESVFYTVRLYDAHAWPEVYFPGIGWVEFEPTVNQAALVRPLDEASLATFSPLNSQPILQEEPIIPEEDLLAEEALADQAIDSFELTPANILLGTLSAVAVISLIWRRYRKKGGRSVPVLIEESLERFDIKAPVKVLQWAKYSTLPPLTQTFMEINSALRRMGKDPLKGDTPRNRSAALFNLIPRIKTRVADLNDRYERAMYKEEKDGEEGLRRTKWAIRAASFYEQSKIFLTNLRNLPRAIRRRRRRKRFTNK